MQTNRYRVFALLAFTSLIVLLTAQPARANAGTPLMWAGLAHLAFGNLLIGIFEAILLYWLLRPRTAPMGTLLLLMIGANYISAWAGFLLLTVLSPYLRLNIYNVDGAFWMAALVLFVLTVLLESLFIARGLRPKEQRLPTALRGSLLIHLVSYSLLFGWYWMAGGRPLAQSVRAVPYASLPLPEGMLLYYIDAQDGNVYRLSSDNVPVAVKDLASRSKNDRLFARKPTTPSAQPDLVVRLDDGQRQTPRFVTILPGFASPTNVWTEDEPRETWMNFGSVPSLTKEPETGWSYTAGFWPNQGLSAYHAATGQHRWLVTCQSPLTAWMVRNAIQLPGGLFLFQFGDDQICLYDLQRSRLSLIVRGRGPVLIKTDKSGPQKTSSQTTESTD